MAFIIAEIGNNHEGSLDKAAHLIKLAAESGADAVKFQIFNADKLVHPSLPSRVKGYATQLERMKSLEFTDVAWMTLYHYAEDCGVEFMATCFDLEILDRWAPRLSRIKIASGDITFIQMIRQAASYGKPILLSTGGASDGDIAQAARWIGTDLLTLLHCVSKYPCIYPNLGRIPLLKSKYGRAGYSCHTPGIDASYAAVCLGATVVEKHFTDANRMIGDHVHSATPSELRVLRDKITHLDRMMGTDIDPIDPTLRRGAYAVKPLEAGQNISDTDYICLRPSFGDMTEITGRKTRKPYGTLEAING